MTSRDGYNRNRPTRGSSQAPRESQRQGAGWELDADELDRYMSGQPAREPRFDPYGRSQSSGRTERTQPQPRAPQAAQPQYDDYADPQGIDSQWDDDYSFEDDYGYEEYQPEPDPVAVRSQQPRRQAQPAPRRRPQAEPEFDDDLYDDPYVMDDEEPPQRTRRQPQRAASRKRPQRPSPGFTLPPAIADAPFVKDRVALAMFGAAMASVLIMLIVVMTQRDGLDALIFTHVNANGEPENVQTANAIWNLPLIAGMVTLISAVLGWFLARWSAFLPRFLIGGSIGVQFVVWVSVIAYLF